MALLQKTSDMMTPRDIQKPREMINHKNTRLTMENRVYVQRVRGKSRVTEMVYRYPFKIFNLGSVSSKDLVSLMFSHYGGGMLQGDHVQLKINAGEGSNLEIQSQANAHVFRSEDERCGKFNIEGTLECGSTVVMKPEPVVLHKGARFSQHQTWNVSKGGRLILTDWMQSGRSDSGECFEFKSYETSLELNLEGRPVLKERFRCTPEKDDPMSCAAFMGMNHMISVYLIGDFGSDFKDVIKGIMDQHHLKNPETKRILAFPQGGSGSKDEKGNCRVYYSFFPLVKNEGFVFRVLAQSRLDLGSFLEALEEIEKGV